MSETGGLTEFADQLNRLKQRRGYSYEWISRKTKLSRSSVHRYCTALSVPPDFGPAEQIAKACGASRDELIELHRRWLDAGSTEDSPAETRESTPPKSRRAWFVVVAVVSAIVLAATVLTVVLVQHESAPPDNADPQRIFGPAWEQLPRPVPSAFFGVTMNSTTGMMPGFRVGSVRLWDSRTRWANIQPQRGQFDWSILDRLVGGANAKQLPAMLTFGGTPAWASPNGIRAPYDDGSRAAPPDDLRDWDAFVEATARRYRGRVDAYELWVNGADRKFFDGTPEQLAEMANRAGKLIKSVDPAATVVCPSMDQLWTEESRRVLTRFAELRGFDHCDVAGVKLHQRTPAEAPESMVELASVIDQAFHRAGAHLRLWNTGTSYDIALAEPLDRQRAGDFAVRFYLAGLYARVERMYFYSWGSTKLPVVLQPEGGTPTEAALLVEELQRWLSGNRLRSCGQGEAVGLPRGVWQCRLSTAAGKDARIVWTVSGSATITLDSAADAVSSLDGTTRPVSGGAALTVSTRPVLVRSR